jgi:hypothetical protein
MPDYWWPCDARSRRYKAGSDPESKSEHDALPFCFTPNLVGPSRPGMVTGFDMRDSIWVAA